MSGWAWIALFEINGWLGFLVGVLLAVAAVSVADVGLLVLVRSWRAT